MEKVRLRPYRLLKLLAPIATLAALLGIAASFAPGVAHAGWFSPSAEKEAKVLASRLVTLRLARHAGHFEAGAEDWVAPTRVRIGRVRGKKPEELAQAFSQAAGRFAEADRRLDEAFAAEGAEAVLARADELYQAALDVAFALESFLRVAPYRGINGQMAKALNSMAPVALPVFGLLAVAPRLLFPEAVGPLTGLQVLGAMQVTLFTIPWYGFNQFARLDAAKWLDKSIPAYRAELARLGLEATVPDPRALGEDAVLGSLIEALESASCRLALAARGEDPAAEAPAN